MNKYEQALINLKAELEPVNTLYVKSGEYKVDLALLGELVERFTKNMPTATVELDITDMLNAINKAVEKELKRRTEC